MTIKHIEQCDSCVARATSVICLSNGLKLFLCTHHTNEHKTALEADSATIYNIENNGDKNEI